MALSINTAIPLPQATVGTAYSKTLSATGGTPPYTWAVDGGYTVPDLRNAADPNTVIDPTMVKDSTAGLQKYINSTPVGADITLPFDLQINAQITLGSGRILRSTNGSALRRTIGYPWRPAGGLCAQWQYDAKGGQANEPTSLTNTFWYPNADGLPNKGAEWGGYSGTTGQSGVDYDGLHLTDRYRAPFNSGHIGKAIQVVVNQQQGVYFNKTITGVSNDGKTVYYTNTDGTSQHNDTGGTCAWAITSRVTAWTATFLPNPAWNPQLFNANSWGNYTACLNGCINNNMLATVRLNDTAQLIGVEVEGANPSGRGAIVNYDKSNPIINEFQHCVTTKTTSAKVVGCHLHHAKADSENGPGQLINNRMEHNGRQGCTGHWDGKRITGNVIQENVHSAIDIEKPGGGLTTDVQIVNNCFGGHGMAWSSPVNGLLFQGNHSTQADVNAGTIISLAPYSRITNWGGGGSNAQVLNNTFDRNTGNNNSDPAYDISNVNGLTVANNTTPTTKFFLHATNCTNVDSHGNNGGPSCLGQLG